MKVLLFVFMMIALKRALFLKMRRQEDVSHVSEINLKRIG